MLGSHLLSKLPGILALLGAALLAPTASADWFSEGDRVVTVADTPVMDRSRTVTTLSAGTNFRVHGVQGSYVSLIQEIDGNQVRGWVRQKDVMKIDRNQRAVYATHDNLVRAQGQTVKLPKGVAVDIRFQSDTAVDLFIVSEEGVESYRWVMKQGSGQVSSRRRELNTRRVTWSWTPPDNNQYSVLIDNSSFPDGGANSGRTIHYAMAYCVDDPQPSGPRSDRGLIIGRATLDFDNYEGRHGRLRESYKVCVEVLDDGKVVDTLEAVVDNEGHFFLENVATNRAYRVKKLDGSSFDAPATAAVVHRFATGEVDERPGQSIMFAEGGVQLTLAPTGIARVLDMGHIAMRVSPKGSIQTRIDGPGGSLARTEDGVQFGGSAENVPLDRHEWFLESFRGNGWAQHVRADRDAIYRQREEAERKAKERAREKEEEKQRQQRDAEAKKREEQAKRREAETAPAPEAPIPAPAEPEPGAEQAQDAGSQTDTRGLRNVALAASGANATAVSTGRYRDATQRPALAIDGDKATGWRSHWCMPAWLQVEFEREYEIDRVGVGWGPHRHTFSVGLSQDGENWTTVVPSRAAVQKPHYVNGDHVGGELAYETFAIARTPARFLRIEVTSTTAPRSHIFQAGVNELEAYAAVD